MPFKNFPNSDICKSDTFEMFLFFQDFSVREYFKLFPLVRLPCLCTSVGYYRTLIVLSLPHRITCEDHSKVILSFTNTNTNLLHTQNVFHIPSIRTISCYKRFLKNVQILRAVNTRTTHAAISEQTA